LYRKQNLRYRNQKMNKLFLSKKEIASRYGVTTRTIQEWMKTDRLVFFKAGGIIRFDALACDERLTQSTR
jgi:hypothetical protein